MLTLRTILAIAILALAVSFAFAESQQAQQKSSDHKKPATADKRGTEEKPLVIKVLPSNEAERAAKENQEEKNAKRKTDEDLARFTGQLAEYTGDLSTYTMILIGVGAVQGLIFILQLCAFIWQGSQLKRSVDSAENAVIPVLFPFISNTDHLHPNDAISIDKPDITHTSSLQFVFENYGKTPGIVREVRADLFLVENDVLPKINFDTLTMRHHELIIPGNTKARIVVEPVPGLRWTLSPQAFNEILVDAGTGPFRRFHLIGRVIYDDFFQTRHTNKFCLKLRKGGYQSPQGGLAYNRVTSYKIPKNEKAYPER